jgi:transposase-like protein
MTKQSKQSSKAAVRDIRRRTRRKFSPEEKIRIVLEGCTPITQASYAIRPALDLGTLERSARRVSDLCSHEICFNGPPRPLFSLL